MHGNAHPHVWRDRLLNSSSIDNITGLGSETPNRLLYSSFAAGLFAAYVSDVAYRCMEQRDRPEYDLLLELLASDQCCTLSLLFVFSSPLTHIDMQTNWNSTCNTTEMRPKGRFKAYRRRDTFAMPFDSYDDLFPYTSPKRPRSHHHSHSQHLGSRWQFWR